MSTIIDYLWYNVDQFWGFYFHKVDVFLMIPGVHNESVLKRVLSLTWTPDDTQCIIRFSNTTASTNTNHKIVLCEIFSNTCTCI